jgi:hypothetical protein
MQVIGRQPCSRSDVYHRTLAIAVIVLHLSGCATTVKVPEVPLLQESFTPANVT